MSERSGHAKSIFLEAIEKHAPEQWPAFLEQACVGDGSLRAGVEELLRAHVQIGSFHEEPQPQAAGTVNGQLLRERPGTVIGPYKLLQQLGEGGMGVVWMAEQTRPVQRKVALKVVKPGMDSRQVIARFEAERQALAMMDHVNIARVFDAGATEAGRPYFVMELVHGVPITKYCDDHRLTPRQRLELFIPVCQAIQHAHQKGIIHRDIKPSNVMVTLYDGKPVPKVIDFGVAKATEQKLTERTLFTQYGTLVGTLEYMSPEQAEISALGVDTRSDIYALGVLLYELLTGSTPLNHKRLEDEAYAEILRIIKEEEPPKPSTRLTDSGAALASISANRHMEPSKLTKLLRGELDWIVMKCLEKDRNRRYETANGLAQDVERHLRDERVLACPPSLTYKARKFVRRNRLAFAAAIIVGGALVVAVVGLMVSNTLIRAEQVATGREYKRAELQRAQAEAIRNFLTVDLLGQASPQKNARHEKLTVEQLLDRASKNIGASGELARQPEVEAAIRHAIGDTYFKLGVLAEADRHLRRALDLRLTSLGPEHPDTLVSQETLAWFMVGGLHRPAEAEALSKKTWETRRRVLGSAHPDTLDSMDTYASALSQMVRTEEAERLTRQCWEISRDALGPEHPRTLIEQSNLGQNLIDQGKWAEALPLLGEALNVARRLGRLDTESGVAACNNLAVALLMIDQLHEAEVILREALVAARTRHGKEHFFTLQVQHMLSRVLLEAGRHREAEVLSQESLTLRQENLPVGHEDVGRSLLLHGRLLVDQGRPAAAEPLLKAALALFRNRYAIRYNLIGEAESSYGACLSSLRRFDEAEPLLIAGYEKMLAAPNVGAKQKQRALADLVKLYEGWDKPQQAALWRNKQKTITSANQKPSS